MVTLSIWVILALLWLANIPSRRIRSEVREVSDSRAKSSTSVLVAH
jgi:hypothetical protein